MGFLFPLFIVRHFIENMSDEEGEKEPATQSKEEKVSRKSVHRSFRAQRREAKARLGYDTHYHQNGLDLNLSDPIFPNRAITYPRNLLGDYHSFARPDFGGPIRYLDDTEEETAPPIWEAREQFTANHFLIERPAREELLKLYQPVQKEFVLTDRDTANGVIKELQWGLSQFDPLIAFKAVDAALIKSHKRRRKERQRRFPQNNKKPRLG